MNSRLKKLALAISIISLALIVAGPATAQPSNWITGAKITVDNVDNDALSVDITGSIFYSTGVTFTSAFVGVSSGFGTISPAIAWGDGSEVPPYFPSGIPFDTISTPTNAPSAMRAYRMAFSHIYASEGTYPITINSHFTGGFTPNQAFTGTITTAPTPSYATFSGVQTFIQNVMDVEIGGGPDFDPAIPTASEVGLLALALLLGTAGVFFLRR